MDRERFTEHLAAPMGRGVVLSGGFDGHAGGALCGDLIRASVRVEGDRVVEAAFDAEGCGALTAAGSAAVTLVSDEPLLEAARVGTREIAAELGGLSPGKLHAADLVADALHRALGAAARTASVPESGRCLVAMSGGVDSAVAALLVGDDAVAVTLELWRDEFNDAEASCCWPTRSGSPARWRTRWACRTSRSTCATSSARASWTRSWPATRRGRRRTRASAATATYGWTRCSSWRPAWGARRWRRGTTRGSRRTACCGSPPTRPRTRPPCSLVLSHPLRSPRMRFPLAEMTKAEVRALALESDLPVAKRAGVAGSLFPGRCGQGAVPGAARCSGGPSR